MEVNVSEETFLLGNIASSFVILLRKKRIRAAAPNTGEVPPVSNDGETHFVCVQGETSQTAWRLPVEKSIRT